MSEIEDLRREVADLRAEVERLGARDNPAVHGDGDEGHFNRRHLFALAAGGAAALAGVAASEPAAAGVGAMQYGAFNDSGVDRTSLTSSSVNGTFFVSSTAAANSNVWATTLSGNDVGAVRALSLGAREALFADSLGGPALSTRSSFGPNIRMFASQPSAPTSGSWRAGDIVHDTTGVTWACVVSGTPGSWRRLAAPTAAGSFTAITPVRAYDSRRAIPQPGPLAAGATRTISVADARDPRTGAVVRANVVPPGVQAVAINVTITETVGSGYIAVAPGGARNITTSTLNWTGSNQTLANGAIVAAGGAALTILCGPANGAFHRTQFIVDVTGYWL